MLTSKEIIERTGISRATLNNYIASGLVPRPQVLPPGPQHGAAPRIGYFPDDTIARVEAIQRLKREGWSITPHRRALRGAPARRPSAGPGGRPPASRWPRCRRSRPRRRPPRAPGRSVAPPVAGDVRHPAYLVDDASASSGTTTQTRANPCRRWGHRRRGSIFAPAGPGRCQRPRRLRSGFTSRRRRTRAHRPADLFRGPAAGPGGAARALYRHTAPADAGLVTQAQLPAAGRCRPAWLYAVHFREGVLFAIGAGRARAPAPAGPPAQSPC